MAFSNPLTRKKVVASIAVTNGGSGYATPPAVSFSAGGGTGATATATIVGGAVTAVTVTAAGDNYDSAPTVAFSGGGGTNAAATASLKDGDILIFRKTVIADFYDSSQNPPTSKSHYNTVHRKHFYSDDEIQTFQDQVLIENKKKLLTHTDEAGTSLPPEAMDPTTMLYRLMRVKAWTIQLTNRDFVAAMFSAASNSDVPRTLIEQMEKQIHRDVSYTMNTGWTPGTFTLERA